MLNKFAVTMVKLSHETIFLMQVCGQNVHTSCYKFSLSSHKLFLSYPHGRTLLKTNSSPSSYIRPIFVCDDAKFAICSGRNSLSVQKFGHNLFRKYRKKCFWKIKNYCIIKSFAPEGVNITFGLYSVTR